MAVALHPGKSSTDEEVGRVTTYGEQRERRAYPTTWRDIVLVRRRVGPTYPGPCDRAAIVRGCALDRDAAAGPRRAGEQREG